MLTRLSFFVKDFSFYIGLSLITFAFFIIFVLVLIKSKIKRKPKKILTALASLTISCILVLSIVEGYFRYVYDESDGLGFLQVNKRWFQRHVVYNNFFKRDKDFKIEKPAGSIRIGVIGDSIAFGQGIPNVHNRFSNILEKKLQASKINAEVYNLGTPGVDTHEEIKMYDDLSIFNFDIIIWQYYLNDIQPPIKDDIAQIIQKNTISNKTLDILSKNSAFFDFAYWRLSSKYSKTFSQLDIHYFKMYNDASILNSHEEELTKFIRLLKEQNKKIVVIIFPLIELLGPNYPAAQIHTNLDSYFKSQKMEVIELLDYLRNSNSKELIASRFDTHPNEKVHKLAAEKLYEQISTTLK